MRCDARGFIVLTFGRGDCMSTMAFGAVALVFVQYETIMARALVGADCVRANMTTAAIVDGAFIFINKIIGHKAAPLYGIVRVEFDSHYIGNRADQKWLLRSAENAVLDVFSARVAQLTAYINKVIIALLRFDSLQIEVSKIQTNPMMFGRTYFPDTLGVDRIEIRIGGRRYDTC